MDEGWDQKTLEGRVGEPVGLEHGESPQQASACG